MAGLVANEIVKQHRKNARTINSNLGQDLVELIGVGSEDAEADGDEMSLHELIVAQIRREVHHRRLTRGEVQGPLRAHGRTREEEAGAAASEDQEPAPVSGREGEGVEDLVLEADETRRT